MYLNEYILVNQICSIFAFRPVFISEIHMFLICCLVSSGSQVMSALSKFKLYIFLGD